LIFFMIFATIMTLKLTKSTTSSSDRGYFETRLGKIQGTPMKSWRGKPFMSYRGIRYAEPPVGDLKFRVSFTKFKEICFKLNFMCNFQPPVPIGPWSGIFDATKDGPVCPQATGYMSDDCLHLNVYTPLMPEASKQEKANLKPVIAYVGGFMLESGGSNTTLEGPEYLLDYDILLVTINYRLGILGFIATKEIAGNNGFKDQQVALRWIRDNIEDYGGDPNSVTFMGWSGGAKSIGYHLQSESSTGLFHRIIMMSGSLPYHADLFRTRAPYTYIDPILKTASLVGCNQTYLDEKIDCLRYTSSIKLGKTFPYMRDEFQCPEISWRYLKEPNFGQDRFDNDWYTWLNVPVLMGFVQNELFHHALLIYQDKKRFADWKNKTAFDVIMKECLLANNNQLNKIWDDYIRNKNDQELLASYDRIISYGAVKTGILRVMNLKPGKGYFYINKHINRLSNVSYGGSNNCK
jgi:acetylcholinesterase